MKKVSLLLAGLLVALTGCRRPYHEYRTRYKTEKAQEFADTSITPEDAVRKNIKFMSLKEARAARIYFERQDELEFIEKVLNHIIKLSDNFQEKADCLFELATIQLAEGRLEKACELFEQLIRDYPGVSCIKQARYRYLLAHYWGCQGPEHDQQMTEKTLAYALVFKQDYADDSEFVELVDSVIEFCYERLMTADLIRLDFYLAKYGITRDPDVLKAAEIRFKYLMDKLFPEQKGHELCESELLELQTALKELGDDKPAEKLILLQRAYTILST